MATIARKLFSGAPVAASQQRSLLMLLANRPISHENPLRVQPHAWSKRPMRDCFWEISDSTQGRTLRDHDTLSGILTWHGVRHPIPRRIEDTNTASWTILYQPSDSKSLLEKTKAIVPYDPNSTTNKTQEDSAAVDKSPQAAQKSS